MPIVHSHASISGHYTNSGCCSLLLLSTKYHVCLLLRQTRTHLYIRTHRHTYTHRGRKQGKNYLNYKVLQKVSLK